MRLIDYCINDPNRIVRRDLLSPVTIIDFDYDYDQGIIEQYKDWPAYRYMLDQCKYLDSNAPRHQTIDSPDKNSCLRYISFNKNDKDLITAIFHFRSQNQLMRYYDTQFAKACVANYIHNKQLYYKIDIAFCVDEFLVIQ